MKKEPSEKAARARMEKFCALYAADPECNATRAAERAGYSAATARQQASRLLKRADVRERIQELRADVVAEMGLTAEHMMIKLYAMYERCMQAIPVLEWDRSEKDFIETGEYRFDARGAAKAAELMMRLCGMGQDKSDAAAVVSVTMGGSAGDACV